MNPDDKPIACDLYDIFEVAAMHNKSLFLTIAGKQQEILVHDVYAKGKEEFLEGTDPLSQEPIHIHLDQIEKVFDPTENKSYIPTQC